MSPVIQLAHVPTLTAVLCVTLRKSLAFKHESTLHIKGVFYFDHQVFISQALTAARILFIMMIRIRKSQLYQL